MTHILSALFFSFHFLYFPFNFYGFVSALVFFLAYREKYLPVELNLESVVSWNRFQVGSPLKSGYSFVCPKRLVTAPYIWIEARLLNSTPITFPGPWLTPVAGYWDGSSRNQIGITRDNLSYAHFMFIQGISPLNFYWRHGLFVSK